MVPKMTLLFYTVRKLINRGATSNLSNMINKLHPADIAQVMQQLGPSDRFFLFGLIVRKTAGRSWVIAFGIACHKIYLRYVHCRVWNNSHIWDKI